MFPTARHISVSTPSRLLCLLLGALVATPLMAQTAQSKHSKPAFPLPSPLPVVTQEQFIAYWTAETGWSSELQLRNNSRTDLTVTPVLRLPNGAETLLVPITVKSEEAKSVDLDQAILTANASQLIGAYGSAVLRYASPTRAALYAAIMIRQPGHPVEFHVDATGQWQDLQNGSREGIWWLPTASASSYLILTNLGANGIPVTLSLYDANGGARVQNLPLPPHQMVRLSLRSLVQATGFSGSYGGIKVSASSYAGSLDTLHFLFDDSVGFSAIMKMFDYDPNAKIQERDYAGTGAWTLRAPMLSLSNPDPAIGFPAGTSLDPQLFIRNTTSKTITSSLRFNWRSASATGKAAGPSLTLSPYQTQRIDVTALQAAGALPISANWASVTLVTNSKPDEVMAVAASYDPTYRYGTQTPFSDQLTFEWKGGMWEYDAYHDSIITAGNGGTQQVTAAFTIFYNQGTQRYELDQTLQPDDQMWVDVGQLIRNQVPDKNGNTLPAGLMAGSYMVREISNKGAGTLFEGKVIYDKMYGHAAYGCALCCGYATTGYGFWYDPLGIPDDGTADQGVDAPNECDGGQLEDVSGSFYGNWTTGNSSIATVDHYGTHTGVSIGATTSKTTGELNCNDVPQRCPLRPYNPSGNDNTQPQITGPSTVWYFSGLSPSGYATSITLTSSAGSNTQWSVTAGGTEVRLSTTTGSTTTITSSGVAFSTMPGDVTIEASITVEGQPYTSDPFYITTRKPYRLVSNGIQTNCDSTWGYLSTLTYTIEDQLSAAVPAPIGVNESWTTNVVNDYPGTNWVRGNPNGITTTSSAPAGVQDTIGGEYSSYLPIASCNGNATTVQHWGQEWMVGSTSIGQGSPVQTDTLQKYINHADHESITSPVP